MLLLGLLKWMALRPDIGSDSRLVVGSANGSEATVEIWLSARANNGVGKLDRFTVYSLSDLTSETRMTRMAG